MRWWAGALEYILPSSSLLPCVYKTLNLFSHFSLVCTCYQTSIKHRIEGGGDDYDTIATIAVKRFVQCTIAKCVHSHNIIILRHCCRERSTGSRTNERAYTKRIDERKPLSSRTPSSRSRLINKMNGIFSARFFNNILSSFSAAAMHF